MPVKLCTLIDEEAESRIFFSLFLCVCGVGGGAQQGEVLPGEWEQFFFICDTLYQLSMKIFHKAT